MQLDATTCSLCGLEWREDDRPDQWLTLEVTRGDGVADSDRVYADFCCQAHAAEWLTRPLPPSQPLQMVTPTWTSRLTNGLVLLLFLWAGALMLLGAYALARLVLGGWD